MEVTIKKIYKGNGFREGLTLEEAKHYLEDQGYYKAGTIDKLLEEKKEFTLQSDFAVYEFQIIN